MSAYRAMLDTNTISNVLRYPVGKAAAKFRTYAKGELCASIAVAAEIQFGVAKLG